MCVSNKRTATNIPETKYLLHQLFKDHLISSLFPVLKWIHFLISVFFTKSGFIFFLALWTSCKKKKKKIEDLVPKSSVVNGRMDEHPFYVPWSQKILGFLRFSGFFVFVFCVLFFFWGGGGGGVFLLVEAIPSSGSHYFFWFRDIQISPNCN